MLVTLWSSGTRSEPAIYRKLPAANAVTAGTSDSLVLPKISANTTPNTAVSAERKFTKSARVFVIPA